MAMQQASPRTRQVLGVSRVVAGSDAAVQLQPGDLLLAIDGRVVTGFREVERAVADAQRLVDALSRTDQPAS